MVIVRKGGWWSPRLDKNIFQFSGRNFGRETWFYTENSSGQQSVFEDSSVVLAHLTFLKRK